MANDDIKELLRSLLASNQEVKEEIKQNRTTLSAEIRQLKDDLRTEIQELRRENEQLKEEVGNLKTKLHKFERETRKYKLMVHGLGETGKEDVTEDINLCLDLFNNKLGINCQLGDLRNVYRVGKPSGKLRPVSIETNSYFLRSDILKNSKKLKGTKIFIAPEYAQEEYEERKILRKYLREARLNKEDAQIKNKKLIVGGQEYSVEELRIREATGFQLPKVGIWDQGTCSNSKRKQSESETQEEGNPTKRVTRNQVKEKIKL